MPPTFYRGCWHVVSRDLFLHYRPFSSCRKGFYDPKAFITHAASLHQGFPHCAISLTAASRRSLGRVSVPVWGVILSDPRPVVGLVGFYPTNYLIGRSPLTRRIAPLVEGLHTLRHYAVLATLSRRYPPPRGRLATCSSPVRHCPERPFDLHVLGTPPAFILSQDQTLRSWCFKNNNRMFVRC